MSDDIDSSKYTKHYSDDSFWGKVKKYAKVAGEKVLEPALKLYYAAQDPDTPTWAKTTIYGALGYFIFPIDLIPDILGPAGYTDDLGVLIAAIAAVGAYIKQEHTDMAKQKIQEWFS